MQRIDEETHFQQQDLDLNDKLKSSSDFNIRGQRIDVT
jgi:hypothetical protein